MRVYFQRAFRVAAVAAAAALSCITPAQAIVYNGAWDPAYDVPFTSDGGVINFNLGWRGRVLFDVAPGCGVSDGNVYFFPANSCAPTVLDAYVDLYDTASPGTALERLDFTLSLSILGLQFEEGQPTGILGFSFPFEYSEAASSEESTALGCAFGNCYYLNTIASTFFSLAFYFPPDQLLESLPESILDFLPEDVSNDISDYNGPLLISKILTTECLLKNETVKGCLLTDLDIGVSSREEMVENGRFSITEVPEPGILGLIAGALIATGFIGRTRRPDRAATG